MVNKLVRAFFGSQVAGRCRRCNSPLHPREQLDAGEGVCHACRLDPARQLAA